MSATRYKRRSSHTFPQLVRALKHAKTIRALSPSWEYGSRICHFASVPFSFNSHLRAVEGWAPQRLGLIELRLGRSQNPDDASATYPKKNASNGFKCHNPVSNSIDSIDQFGSNLPNLAKPTGEHRVPIPLHFCKANRHHPQATALNKHRGERAIGQVRWMIAQRCRVGIRGRSQQAQGDVQC